MKNIILTALLLSTAIAAAHATEFNINGMALGMNADQVVAKYQELRSDGQYSFSKWKLPEGTEWVSNGRTLYNDLSRPDDMEHERMEFAFTGVGSGNKLFAVRRELKFRPSERPSTDAVYAAAVTKYGEPSYSNKGGTDIWAIWKFNALEAPAEKLESSPGCIGTSDFPVGLDNHTAGKAKQTAAVCFGRPHRPLRRLPIRRACNSPLGDTRGQKAPACSMIVPSLSWLILNSPAFRSHPLVTFSGAFRTRR